VLQAASAAYDRLKVADARAAAAVRAGKEANARAEAAEKMLKAEVRSAAEAAESATKKRDVRARHDQTRAGLLFCTAIPGPWMLRTDKRGVRKNDSAALVQPRQRATEAAEEGLADAQGLRRGGVRARSHCRVSPPFTLFITDRLKDSVPLFLRRQCDGTLGGVAEGGRRAPRARVAGAEAEALAQGPPGRTSHATLRGGHDIIFPHPFLVYMDMENFY
jgi:hypothetical protein